MDAPAQHLSPRWAIATGVLAGLLAYWGTLLSGVKLWSSSPDEQHGFLVIPVALGLLYLRRGSFPGAASGVDLRGLGLLVLAAALRIYSERYIRPWMDLWSLPLWVGGMVWIFGGWRMFRWAAPAIAFLFFMAPLPGQVQNAAGYPLQVIAATGGGWLLQMIGQPAFVAGTTILLGEHALDVERACAGLRMFHGMLAVAVAWSMFAAYRWPRFLLLLVLAPLIAVLVNVLRITVTGVLFQYVSGEAAQSFTHDWAGLLMIPSGALAFFVIDSVLDRLTRWNRDRPDRWLMTAVAAAGAVILVALGGYAAHSQQQGRAIELVLQQGRELSDRQSAEEQLVAADYFQRYLSMRPHDAAVISELAELYTALGPEHQRRAARLHELAWREDPLRSEDALAAMRLQRQFGEWQPLWELSNVVAGQLAGAPQITALRLRTAAISQLSRSTTGGGDVEKMFAACREAIRLDEAYFEHTWQLATLTRLYPGRGRGDDWTPTIPPAADSPAPVLATAPLRGAAATDVLIKPLSDADAQALAIIDHYITRHPSQPRPQLYRVSLLESLLPTTPASEREVVEHGIEATLEHALGLVAQQFPLVEDPPFLTTAAAESDREVTEAEATAAFAYLLAGRRMLQAGDSAAAQRLLSHSQALGPHNFQIYLLLAETLPRDATDRRIELFKTGLERCGTRELTLLLPLAEAYLAVGRQADAEALLVPLEQILPGLTNVERGRIELMLASTRASGLAQQGHLREAADQLARVFEQPSVLSQRRNFASLYARTQFQLGSLYRNLGQEAAAAMAFKEGGRFDPESPIWHLDAARAYESAGNLTAALQQYQRAAAIIGRQQPAVYLAIAHVLLAQQRQAMGAQRNLDEARSMIRVASDRGADPAVASALLAETYVVEEKLELALQVIDRQLDQTPESPQLVFSRALIRQLAGDVAAALEDVEHYRAAGATDAEALLLRVLILDRADRLDEAMTLLQHAAERASDDELKAARTQVVTALFRRGEIDEGLERLTDLAARYDDDLPVQSLAADVLADLGMEAEAVQVEQNLRRLEGENGTLWRASRAARLLRQPSSAEQRHEVEQLVSRLEQLLPDWPRTAMLRGQIAESDGRWNEALASYESAWAAGTRDAALAMRILTALNRTGQSQRAVQYANQLETLVPSSTSLFDRAMPAYVSGDKGDYVLQLARRWVENDPTPDNLVRLGQTLMTIAASDRAEAILPSPQAALEEAEQAFATAIANEPENLAAWIASFQLQAELRQDRSGAIAKADQLSQQLQIEPLQRAFVLAQLYQAIGEGAPAGRAFEQAITLADQQPAATRQLVVRTAAQFFATRREDRAVELCRQLLAENAHDAAARNQLVALLGDRNTLSSLSEAIELHREGTATATDPAAHKRLHARLLLARAALQPQHSAGDAAQPDLTAALALVQSISPRSAEDAALLAELLARTNQPLQAFNTYRESMRLAAPTPQRLIRFLDFWNQHYAAEGTYQPVADQAYQELRRFPDAAAQWLRLSLARAAAQSPDDSREGPDDNQDDAGKTGEIKRVSATETFGASGTDDELAVPLRQRETELLREFFQAFVPSPSDQRFISSLTQLAQGLAWANRLELFAVALDQLDPELLQQPEFVRALAMTSITLASDPVAARLLGETLHQRTSDRSTLPTPLLSLVGDALYVAGHGQLAVPYYRDALTASPDDVPTLNSLAIVLAELGNSDAESLELARRAIELEPDNPDRRDTKLVVAMLIGQWDTAAELAQTLQDQSSPLVLLHLAYLAAHQGQTDQANAWFNRARDANVQSHLLAPSDKMMYTSLLGSAAASGVGTP